MSDPDALDALDLDLEAIKARAGDATHGPWRTQSGNHSDHGVRHDSGQVAEWMVTQDAIFIAAARSDVPALVAEVERLRAENETLTEVVGWCEDYIELSDEYDAACGQIRALIAERDSARDALTALTEAIRDLTRWHLPELGILGDARAFVLDSDLRALLPPKEKE